MLFNASDREAVKGIIKGDGILVADIGEICNLCKGCLRNKIIAER